MRSELKQAHVFQYLGFYLLHVRYYVPERREHHSLLYNIQSGLDRTTIRLILYHIMNVNNIIYRPLEMIPLITIYGSYQYVIGAEATRVRSSYTRRFGISAQDRDTEYDDLLTQQILHNQLIDRYKYVSGPDITTRIDDHIGASNRIRTGLARTGVVMIPAEVDDNITLPRAFRLPREQITHEDEMLLEALDPQDNPVDGTGDLTDGNHETYITYDTTTRETIETVVDPPPIRREDPETGVWRPVTLPRVTDGTGDTVEPPAPDVNQDALDKALDKLISKNKAPAKRKSWNDQFYKK